MRHRQAALYEAQLRRFANWAGANAACPCYPAGVNLAAFACEEARQLPEKFEKRHALERGFKNAGVISVRVERVQ